MNLLSDMGEENPWWKDAGAIESDAHIAEWEQSNLHWRPPVIDDFTLDKDAVYTLRGARRIGKTTAVKLLIRTLLKGGTCPHNILFYTCGPAGGARGLYDAVREYLRHRDRKKSERTFIFLDDIPNVKEWQLAIKYLWDMNMLKDCTVIATGSFAESLERLAGRLAGRRGGLNEAMDKVMHPLSFSEYVMLADGALAEKIAPVLADGGGRDGHLDSLFSGRLPPALEALSGDLGALNLRLDAYSASGGMPWIVDRLAGSQPVPDASYAACLEAALDGAAALGRKREAARGVAAALAASIGRTASWRSLARDAGLSSASSAASHVYALEGMFLLSIMYQYNAVSKSTMSGRRKKLHFADPLYLHALHGRVAGTGARHEGQRIVGDAGRRSSVVEGIVAGHLIRMAYRRSPKKPWFLHTNYLACWEYGPGKEVDFVYNDGRVEVPIEVKLGGRPNKRDLDGIIAFKKAARAGGGLILTRDSLAAERECLKVPAALFLLLAA